MQKKEKIKRIIAKYKRERDEYLEDLKRAKADYINYKKDEHRRMIEFAKKEREPLIFKMICVLDNFERAEEEVKKRDEDELVSGFLKIKEQMECFLKEENVTPIKTENEYFDPNYHEAIECIKSDLVESGKIIEEVQKGYLLEEKVIRPAKVKVSQ